MAASGVQNANFIFRKSYSPESLANHTKIDHLLASKLVHKEGTITGQDFTYPLKTGNGGGIAGTVLGSQTAQSPTAGVKFVTEPVEVFGNVLIDNTAQKRSKGNSGAVMSLVRNEIDSMLVALGNEMAFQWYSDGNGRRCTASAIAGTTITASAAGEARNVAENMLIIASVNADGSAPRAGTMRVTGVQISSGTFTVDAAVAGLSVGDHFFRYDTNCIDGLGALNPIVAPAAGLWRGVNRSLNPEKTAGYRINGSSERPEVKLGQLAATIAQNGKRAKIGLVSPLTFFEISRRRMAQVQFDNKGAGGKTMAYGFAYITLEAPSGSINVYSDADCPDGEVRVGCFEDLYAAHLGPYIEPIKLAGDSYARSHGTLNAIEMRFCCLSQSIMRIPGAWGVANN
jgi:hypothetical protein